MKIAVIYQNNQALVQFSDDKFRQLLKEYFKKTKSIDKAIDAIEADIKKEILKT